MSTNETRRTPETRLPAPGEQRSNIIKLAILKADQAFAEQRPQARPVLPITLEQLAAKRHQVQRDIALDASRLGLRPAIDYPTQSPNTLPTDRQVMYPDLSSLSFTPTPLSKLVEVQGGMPAPYGIIATPETVGS